MSATITAGSLKGLKSYECDTCEHRWTDASRGGQSEASPASFVEKFRSPAISRNKSKTRPKGRMTSIAVEMSCLWI
jgi:hypothetical protein